MKTSKPTIIGYTATKRGELIGEGGFTLEDFTAELRDNPAGLKLEPIILLRDYEALQALHEEELFCVRQDRDAHFGEMMRALEQVDAMKAECEELRKAVRRLCNIYVVDDYYSGDLREDQLNRAVERAIDTAMQEERKP